MKQVFRVTVAGLPLNIVTNEEEAYLLSLTDKLSRTISDIVLDGMDRADKLENELAQLKAENDRLLAENEKYRRKLNGKKA